jgi:DNA-binding CsgD family transcriptional regulator
MSVADRESVHELWDELADFPASQTDDALRHLMQRLSTWLGTEDVVWVGAARLSRGASARRDPQLGWRGLAVRHLNLDPVIAEKSARAAREQDTDPGMTTRAILDGVGRFRVHRMQSGFVDMRAFRKTPHYRAFYMDVGIVDRMFVAFPINADTESYLLLDRMHKARRFTAAEAEFVAYVMRGLKWFQRELLLSHGLLLANEALSPMERRIVSLLLTERTEKEIAAELRQSPPTTHKYITSILRKFGVRGRTGLMALWLGRRS